MKHILIASRLIAPFLSLLLAFGIAAGWVYQHMQLVDRVQLQQQQAQAELAAVNQRIAQSAMDKQWIARYLGEFRRLQHNGFIGNDQRLEWNQELLSTSAGLGLTAVTFDIAPQQPHQPDSGGAFKLMDTPVEFTAEISHEGVFARLLDDLRSQGHGIFTVRECTLFHPAEALPLQTRCVFVWHMLMQRGMS